MKSVLSVLTCLSTLTAAGYAAGDDKTPEPKPVVAPRCCPETSDCCGIRFEVYGDYLYLQPNGSDLYYAVEAIGRDTALTVPAVEANWHVKEIRPSYQSAFEVGTKFWLDHCDMNLVLNWERLRSDDSESYTTSPEAGYMVGPFFDIGPNAAAYKVARGKASFHFDEVNLNVGRQICFFDRFRTNIAAGAGYARIKQKVESNYSNVAGTITRNVSTTSTFTGGGPQLSLDYDYMICKNFFFEGYSLVSLFMGQLKNGTTYQATTPELTTLGVPQPNTQRTFVPDRVQLVPGFEQKIGFSYGGRVSCVDITFAFGYLCQIYLNAVQTVDMTAPQVLPTGATFTTDVGVYAVGFARTLSNYIQTGPYASLDIRY